MSKDCSPATTQVLETSSPLLQSSNNNKQEEQAKAYLNFVNYSSTTLQVKNVVTIPIFVGRTIITRGNPEKNEKYKIHINKRSISSPHAAIELSEDEFCFIEDLNSTNKSRIICKKIVLNNNNDINDMKEEDEKKKKNKKECILIPNRLYQILHGNILLFGDVVCKVEFSSEIDTNHLSFGSNIGLGTTTVDLLSTPKKKKKPSLSGLMSSSECSDMIATNTNNTGCDSNHCLSLSKVTPLTLTNISFNSPLRLTSRNSTTSSCFSSCKVIVKHQEPKSLLCNNNDLRLSMSLGSCSSSRVLALETPEPSKQRFGKRASLSEIVIETPLTKLATPEDDDFLMVGGVEGQEEKEEQNNERKVLAFESPQTFRDSFMHKTPKNNNRTALAKIFQTPLDCITPSSTTSSIRTLGSFSKATPIISSFNDPLHSALTTSRTINNNNTNSNNTTSFRNPLPSPLQLNDDEKENNDTDIEDNEEEEKKDKSILSVNNDDKVIHTANSVSTTSFKSNGFSVNNIHSDEEDNLNDLTEEELRAILDSDNEKENKSSENNNTTITTMNEKNEKKEEEREEGNDEFEVLITQEEEKTIKKTKTTKRKKRSDKRKRFIKDESDEDSNNEEEEEERKLFVGKSSKSRKKNNKSKFQYPHILFTGIQPTFKNKIAIERLGGLLVEEEDYITELQGCRLTHLVTDKIRRTVKFLCALGNTPHIVSVDWIENSSKSKYWVQEDEYRLLDEEGEEKFGITLKEVLNRRDEDEECLLFDTLYFFITPNVKPKPEEMKLIIECNGGLVLSTCSSLKSELKIHDNICIITCSQDFKYCEEQLIPIFVDAGKKNPKNTYFFTNEFVLSSVMRQEIINNESTKINWNASQSQQQESSQLQSSQASQIVRRRNFLK
ncbi:hypothetical protein ABK040_010598 [Willaertia magna]